VAAESPRRGESRFRLFHRRGFVLLISAGLISQSGDWVLLVGLPFFVYRLTGSALDTGGIFLAGLVPPILLGSVAGVFVDRWSRKWTMVVTNLVLAVGLLPLLWVHSVGQLWILYAVVVFESCVDPFFGPAEGALIPQLVGSTELVQANGVYGAARQVSRLVGAAAGGIIVGLLGIAGIATVDSASFLASAVILLFISEGGQRLVRGAASKAASAFARLKALAVEWRDGIRVGLGSRNPRVVLTIALILGLGEGVFATLAAPFLVGVLGANGTDYGLFFSAQAVGGIAGGVWAGLRTGGTSPERIVPWALSGFAILDGLLFNYPLVWTGLLPAFIFVGLVGIPAAFGMAAYTSLQQTVVEDAFRGRFLGAASAAMGMTMVLGVLIGGILAPALGVIPLLELQVAAPLASGLLVWRYWIPGKAAESAAPKAEGNPA
jgi:Na+/melibiose symporter-like transporter